MSDKTNRGKVSTLPPMEDVAADVRGGTRLETIAADYDVTVGTLRTRLTGAGYNPDTGIAKPYQRNRPAKLESQHIGGGGQYVAGGDYQGLPTEPVRYRGREHQSTINWVAIDAEYIANGGAVDPTVWPEASGKVFMVGTKSRNHRILSTREEANGDGYQHDNVLAHEKPKQRGTTRHFTDDQCREIALKYRNSTQVTIRSLADEYGVSTSAIHTALRHVGEPTRSVAEANRLRGKAAS